MPAHFQVRFVTDRAKASVVIPDEENEQQKVKVFDELQFVYSDMWEVMNGPDPGVVAYVMLEDIADHFGVQTATVKKRATGLGVTLAKVRKPDAKNAYCSAVTAEDARRIGETFLASNLITGAHVLTPSEISRLMEES